MIRTLLEGISARIPSQCAVCRAWPARPVCDGCVARFAQPVPRCRTCAIRVHGGVTQCGECVLHPPPLDECRAAIDYDFPWADVVSRFKFRGETGWAAPLALLMHSAPWIDPMLDAAQWVVPMPLAQIRLKERGFNQAALLARQLAPSKLQNRLLLRIQSTTSQHTLNRTDRLRNLQGVFVVDPQHIDTVRSARILLVDDVMTTGASLFSAAHALRQAGAATVSAAVLARTPQSRQQSS